MGDQPAQIFGHWYLNKQQILQTCIPFAQTEPLAVSIPINDIDMVDIYIDDTIGVAPDKNDNIRCVSATIPLAIHCITYPLDPLD